MPDANAFRRHAREVARVAAHVIFYGFYRLMFPILAPDEKEFIASNHYLALATALQKVVTGETPRLEIAIPPRHAKSVLASVALPAWYPRFGSDCQDHLRVLWRSARQGFCPAQSREVLARPTTERSFRTRRSTLVDWR